MTSRASPPQISEVLKCCVCNRYDWTEGGEESPVRLKRSNEGFRCGHIYHLKCIGKKFNEAITQTPFSYLNLFFTKKISLKVSCIDNRFQACNKKRSIRQVFESPICFKLYRVWKRCYEAENPCLGKIVLHYEEEQRRQAHLSQQAMVADYESVTKLNEAAVAKDGQISLQSVCDTEERNRVFRERILTIFDKISIFGSTIYHTVYVTVALAVYWLIRTLDLWPTDRERLRTKAYQSIGELYLKIFIKKYPNLYAGI